MSAANLRHGELGRKRKRLNHACDRCRNQRVRCDDGQPSCARCVRAGAECTTNDPRNPNKSVTRHEAQNPSSFNERESIAPPTPGIAVDTQHDDVRLPSPSSDAVQDVEPEERLPALPRFINGNSIFILTQWLDLALARLNHGHRYSHLCQHLQNLQHSQYDEVACASPAEIELAYMHGNVPKIFLQTVYPVFPLHSAEFWMSLCARGNDRTALIQQAVVIAVIRAGGASFDDLAVRCLHYAFTRLHVLVTLEAIDSVVAILLMSLVFRARNDNQNAVHLLGLAVAKAKTLDLHRSQINGGAACRLWCCLFILDKILAIELERVPIMSEDDCDEMMSSAAIALDKQDSSFGAMLRLAKIQHQVIRDFQVARRSEEGNSSSINLKNVIIQKIATAGNLDATLESWLSELPSHLRPTELSYCESSHLPAYAFVAMQYYQTSFLISRNALLVNEQHVQNVVDTYMSEKPYRARIRNGRKLCCNLLRSIVALLGILEDNGARSVFDTVYPPLVASIGLAISIIRSPVSVRAGADLALFDIALHYVSERDTQQKTAATTPLGSHTSLLSTTLSQLRPDMEARIARSKRPDETYPFSIPVTRESNLTGQNFHILSGRRESDAATFADADFSDLWPGGVDFDDWDGIAEALDLPSISAEQYSVPDAEGAHQ